MFQITFQYVDHDYATHEVTYNAKTKDEAYAKAYAKAKQASPGFVVMKVLALYDFTL